MNFRKSLAPSAQPGSSAMSNARASSVEGATIASFTDVDSCAGAALALRPDSSSSATSTPEKHLELVGARGSQVATEVKWKEKEKRRKE